MIKGIDTASGQAGINFTRVKSAGYSFCIVKAGGYNVAPEYVAPHYHEQIDGAKAAGLYRGHYWVVGSGDPAQEAGYFASILYRLDKAHDVLVLDDERLDSNATFWTDGNVVKFFTELQAKTGIPYRRMWFYIGAYNARTNDWPGVKKLGVRVWDASYGANDGQIHTPDLGGKLPSDIQQYTSNGQISGISGVLDLSVSALSPADLFSDPAPVVQPDHAPVSPKGKYMFIITKDGKIWAINPIAETKHHITSVQWDVLKQFDHQTISVTDTQAAAFSTV